MVRESVARTRAPTDVSNRSRGILATRQRGNPNRRRVGSSPRRDRDWHPAFRLRPESEPCQVEMNSCSKHTHHKEHKVNSFVSFVLFVVNSLTTRPRS